MEINVYNSEVRCYVCSVSITHESVEYDGDIELYRYSGGLDIDDIEIGDFEDENGNLLDESILDRSKIFQACINAIDS